MVIICITTPISRRVQPPQEAQDLAEVQENIPHRESLSRVISVVLVKSEIQTWDKNGWETVQHYQALLDLLFKT